MANLLVVAGLGLAGIDPVGMMLLIGAMAKGFSKRQSLTYAVLVFLGTAIMGTLLSAIFGLGLTNVINHLLAQVTNLSDSAWVFLYAVIIVLLLAWGLRRLRHKEISDNDTAQKGSNKGLYGMVAFMVFTAIIDPSFLAVLALSGRHGILIAFFYNLLWVLLSQLPLALLTIAILFNQHQRFVEKYNRFYEKYQGKIAFTITGLIFLVAGGFFLDLVSYLSTDIWLFE